MSSIYPSPLAAAARSETAPAGTISAAELRSFAPEPAAERGVQEAVFPIAAATGAGLMVRVTMQPLTRLCERRTVGVRVSRRVIGSGIDVPLHRLDAPEAVRVDAEAYGQGLALLAQTEAAAALIPIELSTLTRADGRIAYLDACLKAPKLGPAGACTEIQSVGEEITPHQLAEVAVLLGRPASGVMIHVGREGAAIERLQGERAVGGVCLDVHGVGSEAWPAVARLVVRARAHTGLVLLDGLEPALIADAVSAGATHAVLAAGALASA